MEREQILAWLREHGASVHGDPEAALGRAEALARQRAAQQAWLHAKQIAEHQLARWQDRSTGLHARESFVAREFCHELARELKHLEPQPELGEDLLGDFEREARDALRGWIRQVAGEEEHRVWGEVVRFTDARARSLAREGVLSPEERWEYTHSYAETAARLAAILAQDYADRARS